MFSQFRSATRSLGRWRGSAVAVITLAACIGTTTGAYAVVRVALADMPGVPEIGRLGRVYAVSPSLGVERSPVALNEFDATLSKASSFRAVGAYATADATLGAGDDARPVIAGYASPDFFAALGVPPAAGRVFTGGDLAGAPAVVLSDATRRRQFPDGRLTGATVVVNGVERAVVGVMPPEMQYGFLGLGADVWIPLRPAGRDMPAIVTIFARLRDGIEWPAAQAELAGLARGGSAWTWRAIPVADDARSRAIAGYSLTLGPAILLLVIGCVNVACLLMARGIAREKELSVRAALGATRGHLVRLLLVEHLVLALTAGAAGAAMAFAVLRVLSSALAAAQPSLASLVRADIRLLPIALAVSAVACLLFGTVPALRLSRRNVAASLNGVPADFRIQIAGYGGRDAIVFGEIAGAVGFVVWAAMLYTLFAQLGAVATTFPADRVIAVRVPSAAAAKVAARIASVPGVGRTAVSSGMLGGGSRERVEAAGTATATAISRLPVGAGFFETLGVPIVRGRAFDAGELQGRADVAVLGESAARQLAPGGDAVGLRLKMIGRPDVIVVGVCRDAIDYGVLSQVDVVAAEMYVPFEPSLSSPEAVVLARTTIDAHAVVRAVTAAAQPVAGAKPVRPIVVSDDFRNRNPAGTVVMTRALASFALLTMLLAASGVFAVISQSVAQRTREFGIRLAIGATPRGVLGMVLARETKLIGTAVATGVIFTMLTTRALFVDLSRLGALVPSTWLCALAASGGVAAVAVALATWRIVRLAPADVLRRT